MGAFECEQNRRSISPLEDSQWIFLTCLTPPQNRFTGFVEASSMHLLEEFQKQLLVPDTWFRTCRPAHFTASAFVYDPTAQKIILLHHKRLNKWVQPGGHCDGNTDFTVVAQKELAEETGLTLTPCCRDPFDLDVHSIPANSFESAHLHYDWRVLFLADSDTPLPQNQEGNEVKWVSVACLSEFTQEGSILRMAGRAKTLRF